MQYDAQRELTPLTPEDIFLIFDGNKEDLENPIHYHPEYELKFILNGKGMRRIVGDSLEEIGNPELVLVGTNLPHGWQKHNCSNEQIREITIHFHHDLFDPKLLARRIMKPIKGMLVRSGYGIVFSEKVSVELKPKILKLTKTESFDNFLDLISILQYLAVSPDQRMLSSYTVDKKDFMNSEKLKLVYDYVQENFNKKISLNEVSRMVNMSPVSFNRFIKTRTGRTLIEYVNDIRISYAGRWLIDKELNIAEIAYNCGFNNISNFNRIFKKRKECTPSQYREKFGGIKRTL